MSVSDASASPATARPVRLATRAEHADPRVAAEVFRLQSVLDRAGQTGRRTRSHLRLVQGGQA